MYSLFLEFCCSIGTSPEFGAFSCFRRRRKRIKPTINAIRIKRPTIPPIMAPMIVASAEEGALSRSSNKAVVVGDGVFGASSIVVEEIEVNIVAVVSAVLVVGVESIEIDVDMSIDGGVCVLVGVGGRVVVDDDIDGCVIE